ncbi:unnamed protein product [Meloidogyne enterolobii]|uniref:Uncharacterized protein n=1 Tax=Meloidogyne enterolobii TaxID=390850 RepID=A0ACB0YP15_MELEN
MSQQQQQCITEQPQLTGYAEQLNDEQNEKRKKNNDSGPLNGCFCGDCGCVDCCDNNCLPTDCMECLGHIFCCCSLASNTNSGCDCGNVDCGGGGDICCCL